MDWELVQSLAARGLSQRQIAERLGINRRTVARLVAAPEPPRYRRAPAGSILDPLEPMIRRLVADDPGIKAPQVTQILRENFGYGGSVDLVKRRLALLRPSPVRPRHPKSCRPGQVMQLQWVELPIAWGDPAVTHDRIYGLVGCLLFSGAQTAHFTLDKSLESFLEGHVRILRWLGGSPTVCVYHDLPSSIVHAEGDVTRWNTQFAALRNHYGFTPTMRSQEKVRPHGSVRDLETHFKTTNRVASLADMDTEYAVWRDGACNRCRHAIQGHWIFERLAVERAVLRPLPPTTFDYRGQCRTAVSNDAQVRFAGCCYRVSSGSSANESK
jgi:transposase